MTAGVWPFLLIFMYLWKSTGYNMVIYLSSITGIDTTLYEAAVVDGATKRQQVWYITLPCLKNVIIMMFILNVGKVFYSDFGLFYQVTGGIPASLYTTVSTFDTFIYNSIQSTAPIGQTAAASFFQAICSCGTILFANWVVSKIDNENRII
jgi:putative aldouronate transport system permease protein